MTETTTEITVQNDLFIYSNIQLNKIQGIENKSKIKY